MDAEEIAKLGAQTRNRIREYILHAQRKNSGNCIYHEHARCPLKTLDRNHAHYPYECQTDPHYVEYYEKAAGLIKLNPDLETTLGTQLEDTNSEVRAGGSAWTAKVKKITEMLGGSPEESLFEILESS